ncbi:MULTISPECIES: ABC transporter ATP-binding protein [unclassified Agarivorans]|uniref:ABC transporter ATP-binding protein n=1 Tax=unclassified Agarivorans TaxID=2636026 RepID=UPI003D7ED2EE
MAKISINALCYQRGDFQLELDSLTISEGEKVALMGENGCGKSTLINLLTGLIEPPPNSVFYDGFDLRDTPHLARAKQFALLSQFSDISFPFSVFEVVQLGRFACSNGQSFSQQDRDKTQALLSLLDIQRYQSKSYTELSGGEQRRVMLARVLNQDAPIVYLDEPNASLDIRHTLQIFEHLYSLPQTIISSVHDINLAHRYFDRFLFLKQGKLLYDVVQQQLSPALLSEVYDVSVTRSDTSFCFNP